MSRANTRQLLGSAALVQRVRSKLLLCDKLYRIRARREAILPGFLVLAFSSSLSRFQFEREATGASASMQNISQQMLSELVLPCPMTTPGRWRLGSSPPAGPTWSRASLTEGHGRASGQRRDDEARATDEDRTHLCRGHAGGPGGTGSGTRCPGFARAGGGSRRRMSGREGRDRFRQDPPPSQKCCTAAVPRHPGRREKCGRVKVSERAFEEASFTGPGKSNTRLSIFMVRHGGAPGPPGR